MDEAGAAIHGNGFADVVMKLKKERVDDEEEERSALLAANPTQGHKRKKRAQGRKEGRKKKRASCKYFGRGKCMKGARCPFLHEVTAQSPSARSQKKTKKIGEENGHWGEEQDCLKNDEDDADFPVALVDFEESSCEIQNFAEDEPDFQYYGEEEHSITEEVDDEEEHKITELLHENNDLKHRVSSSTTALKQEIETCISLRRELEEAQTRSAELGARNDALEQLNRQLVEQNHELKKQCSDLLQQIACKQTENELENRLNKLEKRVNALEAKETEFEKYDTSPTAQSSLDRDTQANRRAQMENSFSYSLRSSSLLPSFIVPSLTESQQGFH